MKKLFTKTLILIVLMFCYSLSFSQLITIGTGTLQNSNTTWPAPYGNWYTGARHQMLIPASEIYAAGGGPGLINSIAFDVATPQGVPLTGFEIKIGGTATTTLTNWESGLVTVYSPGSYTEFAGWNTHVFTTPYVWDGVSNIIIETCFDLYAGTYNYTYSAVVNQTATAYNSTIVYYTDNGAACTTPTVTSTYMQRPNMKMEIIPLTIPVNLGVLQFDYPTEYCDLPSAINLRTKIKNWGTAPQSNFDVSYSIDGGATWVTETNTNTVNPDDTIEHIFSTPVDFSASGNHTIEFAVYIAGDTMNYNDTIYNVVISNYFSISSFPFLEDFETGGTDYFNIKYNSNANAYVYNDGTSYVLRMEGKNPGGWIGGSTNTTPTNAWVDNYTHHSNALSCNIDATGVTSLELLLDLKQYYSNIGPLYSWFRVLVNGVQISDLNGNSDFNPVTSILDPWQTLKFDLQAYVGTVFTLELQASNYYDKIYSNPGDNAFIDNIILREKLSDDVGINALLSQTSGCGVSANEAITIQVKNFGGSAQTGFDVAYQIDGGTIVVENIGAVTLNPSDVYDYTFTTLADLSTPGAHSIKTWTALATDGDLNNDTLLENVYLVPTISTYPYIQDFEGASYWVSGGTSSTWALGTPAGTTINSAASGINSWMTGLTSIYNNSENSWVLGPCFDFSSLVAPIFEMSAWWNSEASWDGAALEYSLDGGTTWERVGAFGDPTNWYNDNSVYGLNINGNEDGWAGVGNGTWVTVLHELNGLGGLSDVKLRIHFGSDGSVNSYDGFAFDDIFIHESPAFDFSVISLIAPSSSCGLTATEDVTIEIVNLGASVQDTIPLGYSFDGGTTIIGPEYYYPAVNPGDTVTYTFTVQADLSVVGTYNFEGFIMEPLDGNHLNDTLFTTVSSNISINVFPHLETFESFTTPTGFTNDWEVNPTVGYMWQINAGYTGSSATGPSVDHTTGTSTGKYVYTEASNGSSGNWTELYSPCVDFSSLTNPHVSWWYHMYGSVIDALHLDVFESGAWINDVHVLTGQYQSSETDDWLYADIDLSAYPNAEKVRFRAMSLGCCAGDIAIDDVKFFQPLQNDLAIISWNEPFGGMCGMTSTENVTIEVYNEGIDPQSNYDVSYSIDGGTTWITENVTSTLNTTDTLVYTFATQADFSTVGTYNCIAIVNLTGDMNNLNDTIYFTVVTIPTISTFPYYQDFEGMSYWTSGGTNSTWEQGTPAGTTIIGAASGVNSWMTGLTASYNNSEVSWVVGPCFDFTSLSAPIFEMSAWWNTELNYDGAVLQYSIDEGITWITVGNYGDPFNWYSHNSVSAINLQTGDLDAWAGNTMTDWVTVKHDLTGLGGEPSVKLRVFFASDGSVVYDGCAFDNVMIYDTPNYDLAVIDWLSPLDNCPLSTQEDITITILNAGLDTISNFPVSYSLDNGSTWITNEIVPVSILPGDSYDYTFVTQADFSTPGIYNCKAAIMDPADEMHYNDTLSIDIEIFNPVSSSFIEDFETSTVGAPGVLANGWSINPTSGYTWYVNSGTTSSSNTGPLVDHTTGGTTGKYVYTEASNGAQGDIAELYFPCIDLTGMTNPAISFWYHMYGASIDTLFLDIFDGGVWNNGVFFIAGQQQVSGSDPWLMTQVDITSYINATEIRFRAKKGVDYYGDIAIDDINILEPTVDVGITELSGPISACSFFMPSHLVLKVASFGTTTINVGDTIPIGMEINGNPPVVEPFILLSNLIYGGTQFFVSASTFDFTAIGSYDIVAYTIMPGDVDNLNDTIYGTINNYGNPVFDLGSNITTTQPDTVVLDAGTYASYLWQDATTLQTFNVDTEGWYYVTITDVNGCTANDSIYVGNSLSDDELFAMENSISIYPNPNNGIFTISVSNEFSNDWVIELINSQGQLVYQTKIDDVRYFNKKIDISTFAQGLYYVKINNKKGFMIDKVVIK